VLSVCESNIWALVVKCVSFGFHLPLLI